MIIHASLQTDIATFYMNWFIRRLEDGFFDIRSNKPGIVNRYKFSDNPVEKIYLHTKNPYKIIKNYSSLKKFKYPLEVVTHITMYDKFYETKVTDKNKIFNYIRDMKKLIGRENNNLCYGPIFKTIINDDKWHVNQFKFLCKILYKEVSVIYYDFSINNLCKNSIYFNADEFNDPEKENILSSFREIAKKYNIELRELPSIENFRFDEIDIGEKDSCPAICKHCKYISNSKTAILKSNMHSPESSLLIGRINSSEKIVNVILKEEIKPKITSKTETSTQFSLFDFV